MSILATDNFNRANANPIDGAWATITSEQPICISSNVARETSLGADCASRNTGATYPNDQYAQAKCSGGNNSSADEGVGMLVRGASAARTYYRLIMSQGSTNAYLSKKVSGTYTNIWGRVKAWADGNTIRLEAQGTTLRGFVNGSQIGADQTDSAIASGNPGLATSSSLSGATGATWDDFEGGDFGTGVPALTMTLAEPVLMDTPF